MLPYTIKDIKRSVSNTFFLSGKMYLRLGRVKRIVQSRNGQYLAGEVQGTASRPYQVTIQIMRGENVEVGFFADCSCPVGFDCKHVAAVLLGALSLEQEGALEETTVSQEEKGASDPQVSAFVP